MIRTLCCLFTAAFLAGFASTPARAQQPEATLAADTPKEFKPIRDEFDYERREAMIAMRDGAKLFTVILIPKGAQRAPMLLTRTPYDADKMTRHAQSNRLAATLHGYDNFEDLHTRDGYIRVIQDIRGKYKSEGDYVVTRPPHGALNPTAIDHATDTWDTIDWLVKNVPESNGKVGILGISYDGFTALTALFNPHPALKVSVPMNPMVDGWMGDDWFHNGAFRQINLAYIYNQVNTRDNSAEWWDSHYDQYDFYLKAGSAGALGKARGLEQNGFFRKLLAHPAYDAFWQEQALDKLLTREPLKVPVMLVHGLWDQEDIYGDMAVYAALEPKDTRNDKVFLVMGPWNHGGQQEEGSSLGALHFGSDTSLYFRERVLRPFLDQYLKDGAAKADIAPVTVFRTGENHWDRLQRWPDGCAAGCTIEPRALYLLSERKLDFRAQTQADAAEYVSDPATPVPFVPRPVKSAGYEDNIWPQWLVSDQRTASSRPDVATFVSDVLSEPLRISGQAKVTLSASTSGGDGDFVVKLIDVYPDLVPAQPAMGGYELMVAADILRGRYRNSYSQPEPMPANTPVPLRFALPPAHHTFLPGHRIMVQVQSSWFPLYDRNPQTWVDNIFLARPQDYRRATIRIRLGGADGSALVLPVVRGGEPRH
ncbi:MAG: CocE/NonD family hydrolase [Rudaea sp.]|uniref:CocE/NonD family hydrolase n=1 Tax=unclassified Rudaea TaxID=2627037 RepID=UPI0010F93041|nr:MULTISPECIES: CocE/NonD family hydrolase [unclassified Rudaea]MBN8886191.1 CocE/NonD family hydrolase [Rudaea sp.]MBR0346393.1 CocE/NonD family hydrolase [Rudaea sp.]